jgi:hypothetical protein
VTSYVQHVPGTCSPRRPARFESSSLEFGCILRRGEQYRLGHTAGVPLCLVDFVGSVARLAWARENGCQWDSSTCAAAARGGNLEVLELVWEHSGCEGDVETCAEAARGGHLDVLRWAREQGIPWDWRTCVNAARGGHLEVLQWAREHDCPWTEGTCHAAARGGHLEVLQWAREHGCDWNASTCSGAARGGHLEAGAKTRPLLSST